MNGFAAPILPRAILEIAGEDRSGFLQGLVSNDMAAVSQERAIWTALLTPQGRYLHDFFVLDTGPSLWLEVEAGRLDDLARRLKLYKLRAKVSIAAVPAAGVTLAWGATPSALGLGAPGSATRRGDLLLYADPRHAGLGLRVAGPAAAAASFLAEAGYVPASIDAWDRQRIAFAVPDGSRDLVPEKSLLLENGFDELHGVSWTKGCYVGQELTARTKYRGLLKKRLIPVRIEGPAPAPGDAVLAGGEEAGEMRSVAGERGLALLRLEALEQGLPFIAGAATLHPQATPGL